MSSRGNTGNTGRWPRWRRVTRARTRWRGGSQPRGKPSSDASTTRRFRLRCGEPTRRRIGGRADEDWGFTDADEYAVRREERARRGGAATEGGAAEEAGPVRTRWRPDRGWGWGDGGEGGRGHEADGLCHVLPHGGLLAQVASVSSRACAAGEFTNDDAADQARAEAEAQARMEEVRLAAMRRVGVDAPEIRNLADLAMRRQPGDSDDDSQRADSEDEDENESEKGPDGGGRTRRFGGHTLSQARSRRM